MRHSTVSNPIESCNASSLNSPTLRFCALHLLHGQVLYFIVEPKSKTKELYNQACAHLASQGMLETDLFGLAIILDGEYLFVDPDYKLSKYAPKNWRSSSTHGLDSSGKPLLAFHFRVQFYVESPLLLRDETSRHQYYLQLRHNVAVRNLAYTYVAEDIIYLLVGLALQADFGDYIESQHKENYFLLHEYFPEQMVTHGNEARLYQNATIVHKANRALSKAQAETQFIREASSRDSFPLAHNSHLYRLKYKKHDPNPGTLWLAICTKGIELYEEKSSKPINGTFLWNSIGKLCFDRKKFEIRSLNPSGERMIYYTSSDEKSKHLLTLCRLTHQFCMAIQTRLNELTRKEEEEKKQYRDWGTELNVKLTEMCYNHNADQRISVISTTSSNTTSGIVSDRVQSLDESEDDLDMEIMINSPPAASIESLALAHLRDSFSKEIRRINKKIPHNSSPAYQSVVEVQGETSESFCLSKLTLPTTSAATEGSQCSSSCSTVVVTGYGHEETKPQSQQSTIATSNRSHSATSSLELGYSHTAQNSTLSDSASCCLELDYSVQSAHTSSGIYTLQSSCETNTVTTTAIAGSSETSGLGQSVIEDSEGIRSRSGSIVSAPGSFHGDGSDPSDTGHRTPLTAEELSDLIVGRSPKPCRGKYPSVATVSETLDSVADYVTLPPPPIPPPCRMSFKMIEPSISHSTNFSSIMSSKSSEFSSYMARQGSMSNDLQNSNQKYFSEEAMLQRQIQFQHLAAGFSPHLFMDTFPTHLMSAKPHVCSSNDVSKLDGCATESVYTSGYPLCKSKEQQQNHKSCISLPFRSEETTARIISSKPQINMLKAQSSYVPSSSILPSYASTASALNCNNQYSRSQQISNLHSKLVDMSFKNDHCTNSVPVVGSNNYLDVRRSGAAFLQQIHEKYPPPPPLLCNRQPPPPPPPPRNHHSVCNNLLTHQFDQYRQQLYSDVDYVIYPMKDPAISKQEYLDSKEASGHCSQYLSQTSLNSKLFRPYNIISPSACSLYSRKSHALCQSTPNVAIAGGCIPPTTSYQYPYTRFASNQNLSLELSGCSNSSLVYLSSKYPSSTSPLYSTKASVYSSSMQSLRQDSSIYGRILPSSSICSFTRTRSDDNILNCSDEKDQIKLDRKFRKPPPPPPPPYSSQKNVTCLPEHMKSTDYSGPLNSSLYDMCNQNTSETFELNNKNISLDICSLREKSKNLDLPLISALCNDKSLLKQTNTVDVGKEQFDLQCGSSWYKSADKVTEKLNQSNYGTSSHSVSTGNRQSQSNNCIKSVTSHKEILKSVISPSNSSVNEEPFCAKVDSKKTDFAVKTSKYSTNGLQKKSFAPIRKLNSGVEVPSSVSLKLKSANSKLTKSPSSTNKLKYSISQPIQKTVAKVKNTSINDSKNNFINKVKCRSSKIKSVDLNSQSSRSTDVNN